MRMADASGRTLAPSGMASLSGGGTAIGADGDSGHGDAQWHIDQIVSSCRQNVRRSAPSSARKLPSGGSNAHSLPKGGRNGSDARNLGWLMLPSIRTEGLIVDMDFSQCLAVESIARRR
ncbi:hypothetical protein AYM40_17550 [Paraburkholderia phytofirmans OLGA172]|uniref:Uncharacterized protein n=1 Tax=Paraburkholderia phytofirmans OLGA172 TaxID=1417228 RepID=A0A160FNT4_9BURK|nr:hypothetical protein AYM40_17550 [Paraburkholderia phytofirmans OLGA172]